MAKTNGIASSIIRELNIQRAVPIGINTTAARGRTFKALLVDDSAWPLTEVAKRNLFPTIEHEAGYVLRLERHDLKDQVT